MFVSHDVNANKKKFQKPNILRRKTNPNKNSIVRETNKAEANESPSVHSTFTSPFILDNNDLDILPKNNFNNNKSTHIAKKKSKTDILQGLVGNFQENTENVNTKNNIVCINNSNSTNIQDQNQSSLNVESFLLDGNSESNIQILDNDLQELEILEKPKWCLDFSQDSHKIIIEHYDDQVGSFYHKQKADITNTMVPLAAVSSIRRNDIQPEDFISTTKSLILNESKKAIPFPTMTLEPLPVISLQECDPLEDYPSLETPLQTYAVSVPEEHNIQQNLSGIVEVKMSMEQLICRPTKFKCDIDDCKKEFVSEQKLKKHKSSHNKTVSTKAPRHTVAECPVKKILASGEEEPCGKIFPVRENLIKHLNEEHNLEEAAYKCTECSRRFFWASGLRVHARSHLARAGLSLACPWPGCSRVFRQPCRLKEHARAHTGDKPYSCGYPNCGWSFRTASKLMRHARRHTGDRRYACAVCGRAFLRREHLRDHVARHHTLARRIHNCPQADCQQTFTNMSSLYMHMKKVHKKEEEDQLSTAVLTETQELSKDVSSENMFMVSLTEPSSLETETVRPTSAMSGHSARTHCTWPLARADRYQTEVSVLEEEAQVEQSESSESNIYTVRSDLFLHGNVLHNEDSEQMGRCVRVTEPDGEGALTLDTDLMLDAPSVHLDQEELYTDAVDESAFRVFLLSGEELA